MRGRLSAVDHDLRDELVLHALGGSMSECVRLLLAWRDYRLEPHLIGALISGEPGMLARQTIPVFGPSLSSIRTWQGWLGRLEDKTGVFGVLRGLLDLDDDFRGVLAAGSALALARRGALSTMMGDDRSAVEQLTRSCLAAALGAAVPGAGANLAIEVQPAPAPTLLFSRVDRAVVGRVSVEWLALFALGLATFRRSLVTSVMCRGEAAVVDLLPVLADGSLGLPERRRVSTRELLASASRPSIGPSA